MSDHARRMLNEALGRMDDARRLEESFSSTDSAFHLRILGFEILLKCAIVICGKRPERTHCYLRLWNTLPAAARDEIMRVASERMPGLVDLSDLDRLLAAYQYIFERARYFYERYEGWSDKEVSELTQLWLDLGAPIDEADVANYSEELVCLTEGLQKYIESRL